MKTTGLFTTHRVEVQAKIGEPIKLIPFGDVHRDSDMHAHTHWQEFLKYAKAQKNALFLGMGDYTDGVSTSERIVLGNAGLHDTTTDEVTLYADDHSSAAHQDSLAQLRGWLE